MAPQSPQAFEWSTCWQQRLHQWKRPGDINLPKLKQLSGKSQLFQCGFQDLSVKPSDAVQSWSLFVPLNGRLASPWVYLLSLTQNLPSKGPLRGVSGRDLEAHRASKSFVLNKYRQWRITRRQRPPPTGKLILENTEIIQGWEGKLITQSQDNSTSIK